MPFTVESDLIEEGQTAEEPFDQFLETCESLKDYHESLQRMLEAQSKIKRIDEARKEEEGKHDAEKGDNEHEKDVKLIGEAEVAMHDVQDMEDNASDHLDLDQCIEMLNEDQKCVFGKILEHLNHQHEHDTGKCKCDKLKPLQMFVSGVGGTGKSFLIETIRSQVKQIWKLVPWQLLLAWLRAMWEVSLVIGCFNCPLNMKVKLQFTGACLTMHRRLCRLIFVHSS